MSVKRQVTIFAIGIVALVASPPFVYTLITGDIGLPRWIAVPRILLILGWLILGTLYLTVGAAVRHNSRRE